MALIDNFDRAPMALMLVGLQRQFNAVLGVSNMTQQFHQNWKQGLRASKPMGQGTNYPYGWFKLTSIVPDGDRNIVNMARAGTGRVLLGEANNSSIGRTYLFPITVSLDCAVKFDDSAAAVHFCSYLAIILSLRLVSFDINYKGTKWQAEVSGGSGQSTSVSIPTVEDLNDGSTPGTVTVEFQLSIRTKCGFVREVAKLNNLGVVQMNVIERTTSTGFEIEVAPENEVDK